MVERRSEAFESKKFHGWESRRCAVLLSSILEALRDGKLNRDRFPIPKGMVRKSLQGLSYGGQHRIIEKLGKLRCRLELPSLSSYPPTVVENLELRKEIG